MAGIEALGRLTDYSVGVAPVDLSGGAQTGKRVSLKNTSGVQVVIFKGAASSGTDPTFTFKEATSGTSGSPAAPARHAQPAPPADDGGTGDDGGFTLQPPVQAPQPVQQGPQTTTGAS